LKDDGLTSSNKSNNQRKNIITMPAIVAQSQPPQEFGGRARPEVWLCNGELMNINYSDFYSSFWTLGVVMSYPVNSRHLALNAGGSGVCMTLESVRSRVLHPLTLEQRQRTFVTDIFPYVGHPSVVGATQTANARHTEMKRSQARRILMASAAVLLICGAAARDAVYSVVSSTDWVSRDASDALGLPSVWLLIEDRVTLIIFQAHPSLDRADDGVSNIARGFMRRQQLLSSLMSGRDEIPTGSDIVQQQRFTTASSTAHGEINVDDNEFDNESIWDESCTSPAGSATQGGRDSTSTVGSGAQGGENGRSRSGISSS
jgi:hypothetical protein